MTKGRGRCDILAVSDAASGDSFGITAGFIKKTKIHGLALTGNKDAPDDFRLVGI